MDVKKKEGRYERVYSQIQALLQKSPTPLARMATINAVLHHKMEYFFWTGFYLLENGNLTVGPYQGSVACQLLEKGKGVCWASLNNRTSVVVEDVHLFPGHIACDSRSNSEIAIPLPDANGELVGVFDVDSKEAGSFDETDRQWLERIVSLIYAPVKAS